MRKAFYIVFLIIISLSCYHEAPVPKFNMSLVIPADSMVSILTDIQLVEGAVIVQQRKGGNTAKLSREYTDEVLEKHHITQAQLEESIRYYTFYIDKMNKIYDEVITRLSIIQSENDARIRKSQGKEKEDDKPIGKARKEKII
jgi:hypothetical protein